MKNSQLYTSVATEPNIGPSQIWLVEYEFMSWSDSPVCALMSFCFKDPQCLLNRLLPWAIAVIFIQENCLHLHYRPDSIISKLEFKAVCVYSQMSLVAVRLTSPGIWQTQL